MESYPTNCYIANKNIYFYCRLWKPRAPFKFRPGISWGRMKQLQPVIYLHLAQWPPPTPHSHYFHIVLLSRPLREGVESSSGALRDVQEVLICALYSISTSREKQTESHPRGEQHRVRFIQSGASDGARCTASLSSSTPGLCKLTLEGTNSLVVEGPVSAALRGSYRTRAWIIVVSPFPRISCWTAKHAHHGIQRNKANRCCLMCWFGFFLAREEQWERKQHWVALFLRHGPVEDHTDMFFSAGFGATVISPLT